MSNASESIPTYEKVTKVSERKIHNLNVREKQKGRRKKIYKKNNEKREEKKKRKKERRKERLDMKKKQWSFECDEDFVLERSKEERKKEKLEKGKIRSL